jgi:hypothetical protein
MQDMKQKRYMTYKAGVILLAKVFYLCNFDHYAIVLVPDEFLRWSLTFVKKLGAYLSGAHYGVPF